MRITDIRNIGTGKELDVLMATEVMGWTKTVLSYHRVVEDDGCMFGGKCKHCGAAYAQPHKECCQTLEDRWVWRASEDSWEDTGDPKGHAYQSWSPSTRPDHMMQVVNKLAPLVGDFAAGDGFFILKYGEFAYHGGEASDTGDCECLPSYGPDIGCEDPDPAPWSAHFHVGIMGEGPNYPTHWKHGSMFCAVGLTPCLAFCRAALLAIKEWPK